MLRIDLIELADCFTPKEITNCIFKQCPNLRAPIPVEDIASQTGIIKIEPFGQPCDSFEGMLIVDEEKSSGVIIYNAQKPIGRRRFSIAHELGHFLIPHHAGSQYCSNTGVQSNNVVEEKEADEFARRLLLPSHLLIPEIEKSPLDIPRINQIADLFQTSFEATANACISLSNEAIAIAYIRDSTVRYVWMNAKHFTVKLKVWKNDPVPLSYQAMKTAGCLIPEFMTLDSNDWLASTHVDSSTKIYGQTHIQENGYSAVLLKLVFE